MTRRGRGWGSKLNSCSRSTAHLCNDEKIYLDTFNVLTIEDMLCWGFSIKYTFEIIDIS